MIHKISTSLTLKQNDSEKQKLNLLVLHLQGIFCLPTTAHSEGFSLFHRNDVIPIAWLWSQRLLTDYIAYLFNR